MHVFINAYMRVYGSEVPTFMTRRQGRLPMVVRGAMYTLLEKSTCRAEGTERGYRERAQRET